MNIFVTYDDPNSCAEMLDDRRVNKMLTESMQMLAIAIAQHGATPDQLPKKECGTPYKTKGHANHPCSVWARATRSNYLWLWEHTDALYRERVKRPHKKLQNYDNICKLMFMSYLIPDGPLTPFVNSTNHHKHVKDIHEAYRLEMLRKWNNPTINRRTGKPCLPTWYGELEFPGWLHA